MMFLLYSLVFLAYPFLTFSLPSSSSSSSSSSHQLELITSESDLFSSTSPHILLDNILLFKEKSCSRELIQWNDRNHNFHHGDDAYKKYFMTDELALKYYHHENSPPPSSGCIAVCLSIGTSRDYITDLLPAYVYASHGRNNFTQWYNLCQNVELGILSQYEEPVIVYSIHPKTEERSSFYTLQPRNLIWSTVHLCSKLQITFANNTLILVHQTCTSGIVVLNQTEVFLSPVYNVPQSVINSSLHNYWNQSRSISRTFTEFGFEKVRLPPELWSSISTYYRNNYQSYSIDYTQLNNFHTVNWWNSSSLPMKKIEIPPILEKYWSQLICQYVEMWSQRSLSPFFSMKQKIQHTSSTGLRVYSENSYILPHVENKSDTAFTVVINVDQTELLEPWVAQIYDFFGRLHEVVMFPGDILMYESAKVLYGRIVPLSGTQYVDLIFHYRPLQPELWYLEENPDDSIPPLGEISDCHEEVITEILQEPGNPSGDPADISFSTTICTEVKTGKLVDLPFLSPSFTRIESGNDLYQFWHTLHGTTGQTSEPTIIGE